MKLSAEVQWNPDGAGVVRVYEGVGDDEKAKRHLWCCTLARLGWKRVVMKDMIFPIPRGAMGVIDAALRREGFEWRTYSKVNGCVTKLILRRIR